MSDRKPLSFPTWLEAIIVLILLVMAVVEYNSGQYFFTAIFGLTGLGVGANLIARLAGEKNDKA